MLDGARGNTGVSLSCDRKTAAAGELPAEIKILLKGSGVSASLGRKSAQNSGTDVVSESWRTGKPWAFGKSLATALADWLAKLLRARIACNLLRPAA
jgi:hypothetical protein